MRNHHAKQAQQPHVRSLHALHQVHRTSVVRPELFPEDWVRTERSILLRSNTWHHRWHWIVHLHLEWEHVEFLLLHPNSQAVLAKFQRLHVRSKAWIQSKETTKITWTLCTSMMQPFSQPREKMPSFSSLRQRTEAKSFPFHPPSMHTPFPNFAKCLVTYHSLHDCVMRLRDIIRVEPLLFCVFSMLCRKADKLHGTLPRSHRSVLQSHAHLRLKCSDRGLQWYWKNRARMERELHKSACFLFAGPELPSCTTAQARPITTCCPRSKRQVPVKLFICSRKNYKNVVRRWLIGYFWDLT